MIKHTIKLDSKCDSDSVALTWLCIAMGLVCFETMKGRLYAWQAIAARHELWSLYLARNP